MSLRLVTWTVDVEWSTHEDLREGRTAVGCHRVVVTAKDSWQAQLIAAQMVGSTMGMPTRTRLVIEE